MRLDLRHRRRRQVAAAEHDARDVRADQREAFERVHTDVLVLGQDDPATAADLDEPLGIGRVLREVIVVGVDVELRRSQRFDDEPSAERARRPR
ncbi:hypothetical protein WMF11_44875 [Sorangium sp. So ce295]